MLQPEEALEAILARIPSPSAAEGVPLGEARGRTLAQTVTSDVDMPPFEKSAMDGYAVRCSDFASGAFEGAQAGAERELPCVGESRAGAPFEGTLPPFSCLAIYTGAVLPAGADAVVMVEHTRREGLRVFFQGLPRAGQNVSHRAEILATGGSVFEPRRRLSSVDLSVLAAVGCDPVQVHRRPVVTILTSGDELVPVHRVPAAGQIREGNTLYLKAACEALGVQVRRCEIVPDQSAALELAFFEALRDGDALITTGGVSMGRYDLVGASLEKVGVEPVLHKVAIKPGKPIWFGCKQDKPVFGLPGNPVSSLLGFEAFVRPALARMAGGPPAEERPRLRRGRWRGRELQAADRQINLPVLVSQGADGVEELEPLPWKGSADIVALTAAGGFGVCPAGGALAHGELCDYRPLDP